MCSQNKTLSCSNYRPVSFQLYYSRCLSHSIAVRSLRKVSDRYIYACYVSRSTRSTKMFFHTHTLVHSHTLTHTHSHTHSDTHVVRRGRVWILFQRYSYNFRVFLFCGASCVVYVCVCIYVWVCVFMYVIRALPRNSKTQLTI